MKNCTYFIAVFFLWCLTGAETTAAQAPEGVQRLLEQLGNAVDRGDVEAAAALYAEDARIYTPAGEVLSSPQAIQQFHRAGGGLEGETTEGFLIGEDTWFEIGTYTAQRPSAAGEVLEQSGGYTALIKQEGEVWRLYRVVLYNHDGDAKPSRDG